MYKVHSDSVSDITLHFAKQCALIAVDEILKTFIPKNKPNYISEEITYYKEVKQEIEKL